MRRYGLAPGGRPVRVDPLVAELVGRRAQLGVRMVTVEAAMGYAPTGNLGRYERGLVVPGLDVVRRWADALGCLLVLVPLDDEGEADHDPELPAELLTLTQRRELLHRLAGTDRPAGYVAGRTGFAERTVYRARRHWRSD